MLNSKSGGQVKNGIESKNINSDSTLYTELFQNLETTHRRNNPCY